MLENGRIDVCGGVDTHRDVNRTGIHRGLVVWAICGVVGLV